jgi:hypothetical protein
MQFAVLFDSHTVLIIEMVLFTRRHVVASSQTMFREQQHAQPIHNQSINKNKHKKQPTNEKRTSERRYLVADAPLLANDARPCTQADVNSQ